MFPAKSLIKLAYRIYEQFEKDKELPQSKVVPVEIDKLDIPEPKYPWINRLLQSKLLLKGEKKGHYLTYPPHLLFKCLYARDEVEFNKKLVSMLFPQGIILTSQDISPLTQDGYYSVEIDVILDNEKVYHKVKKCLSDVFFWYVPQPKKMPKVVLLALTQFVRADGRTLLNTYQLVKRMKKKEKRLFINLIHKTSVPIPIIKFILDMLGGKLTQVRPQILHPMFQEEWDTLLQGKMSGTMFLSVINPDWDKVEVLP